MIMKKSYYCCATYILITISDIQILFAWFSLWYTANIYPAQKITFHCVPWHFSQSRNTVNSQHCKPIPVMKTGFSLCTLSLQGKTCFHYRFFPVKNTYTGKTLFSLQGWICSVVATHYILYLIYFHCRLLYVLHKKKLRDSFRFSNPSGQVPSIGIDKICPHPLKYWNRDIWNCKFRMQPTQPNR